MKNLLKSTLAIAVTVALTACGSDSKTTTPTPTPTPPTPATLAMSGSAVKGALVGAKVQIYRASDTGFTTPLTTEPADVQTDANGDYTATVVDASGNAITGALVVRVTADADTQMRCDAAVTCADGTVRGQLIPSTEVADLSLTTLTVAKGDGAAIDADANTLTSMATDSVLAQVASNDNLNIDTLAPAGVAALQQNASSTIGALLGVDLSTTNIYDIKVVDSTNTQAVADAAASAEENASITNTLTLVNASLANLTVEAGSTIASTINSYVQNVAAVSTVIATAQANEEDVAAAVAGSEAAQTALNSVASEQTSISDNVTKIQEAVQTDISNSDTIDVVIESNDVPTDTATDALDNIVIKDVPTDLITGATNG